MKFQVLTLFPEFIRQGLSIGVVGQAFQKNLLQLQVVNPREFTSDVHQTVDDRPFGGGDGMLMLAEPLKAALSSLPERGKVVYLSPQGKTWQDSMAKAWAQEKQTVTLICGRYAGVDQRFIQNYVDEEISLGDFILSGGEIAALAMIDSIARFHPGVLGNESSPYKESFAEHLLECPQFTKPREFEGLLVPEVLLSGNHSLIEKFRRQVAILRTACLRPDLFSQSPYQRELSAAKRDLLSLSDRELTVLGLRREQMERLS